MVDRPELRVEEHSSPRVPASCPLSNQGRTVAVISHGRRHFRCRRKEEVCRSHSVPFHGGKPCVVRSLRYGLQGVRIGEASHAGPRLLRRYRGSRRGAVVTSDDDDAPLLSEGLRRNVVPRVAGSVSVADFGQTVADSIASRESIQFPLPGPHLSDCGDLRPHHRRGLVVEVAPGIVATAVVLPHQTLSSLWSWICECLRLILWIQMSMTIQDGSGAVPVGAVVEPEGFARHSGRFAALATAVDDDDCDTAHDSPSLVDVEPSQQFGRFIALAEPTKPLSRRRTV